MIPRTVADVFSFETPELLSGDEVIDRFYKTGKNLLNQKNYTDAFTQLRQARAKLINLTEIQSQRFYLKISFYLAKCYSEKKQTSFAISILNDALKKFPKDTTELQPYDNVLKEELIKLKLSD